MSPAAARPSEERRRELAVAVWRTIDRLGIERASLREIAKDAGVTTGSVTHHFADRRALLDYALGLACSDATDRLVERMRSGDLVDALAEYLPLDERRRLEGVAWLTAVAAARRDPALARSLADRHVAAREQVAEALRGRLDDDVDEGELELVVDEVLTGTDGIGAYALGDPEGHPPERQLELVRRLLERVGLRARPQPAAADARP